MKTLKLATYTDLGNCKREDINDLISSLVRIGYEVYMKEDYIYFKLGNDDIVEDKE